MEITGQILEGTQTQELTIKILEDEPTILSTYEIQFSVNSKLVYLAKETSLLAAFESYLEFLLKEVKVELTEEGLQDADLKLTLEFDTYFIPLIKGETHHLLEKNHFYATLTMTPVIRNGFLEFTYSLVSKYLDVEKRIEDEDLDRLFQSVYYEWRTNENIKLCLFCKHFNKFPSKHWTPVHQNHLCYEKAPALLENYRANSEEYNELLDELWIQDFDLNDEKALGKYLEDLGKEKQESSTERRNWQFWKKDSQEPWTTTQILQLFTLPRCFLLENCKHWKRNEEMEKLTK